MVSLYTRDCPMVGQFNLVNLKSKEAHCAWLKGENSPLYTYIPKTAKPYLLGKCFPSIRPLGLGILPYKHS